MCDTSPCSSVATASARRSFLRQSGATALAATFGSLFATQAHAAAPTVLPKPQNVLTPDAALDHLMQGNARYVSGLTRRHDFANERDILTQGQNPYAAILSCADSRIAPEYAFDSARGDLFVARVAGNVVNDDVLGSLEYAVAVLKVPVILVMGHDRCGAVHAAVEVVTQNATFPGKIQALAASMVPAVRTARTTHPELRDGLLDAAIAQNVRDSAGALTAQSAIIRDAVAAGTLKIVGSVYRLASGKVQTLGAPSGA